MARFRVTVFGQPIAPWRATVELAEQDAVDEGHAARFPHGSTAYLSVGVDIEQADGDAPMTPDQERWAEALTVLKANGDRSEDFIAERLRALANDPEGRARWRQIGARLKAVREAQAQARAAERPD